ncbi:hypothetical protein FRACYDRAFT_244091 [Fragilariopsis cylindrus CCMP1102]|uniref:Uncharacterized protein n=1 Tax=Fragilariopsis cylindrus CCMP1102 TaxID=635003 RepID=A0A1E7F3V8_9STRA|nr:hypothetical protein FRACYDRAFT_244091 [Fragilariopsis cylindrus CCMP1102]|eukprot:OEU12816.1 hypothetical protein FRACYDRAFT_244091 [Fragilariopsis cylindrus CCMP1102]
MSTPALAYDGPATYCAGDTSGGSSPAAVGSAVGCEDEFDESSTTFIVGGMIRGDEGSEDRSSLEKILGNCWEGPNNESDDGLLPVVKLLRASYADSSEDGNKEMSSFGAFLFGVLLGCLKESRMALSFLCFLLFLSLLRALY